MFNISATRVNTFNDCPLKYKYKYVYKLISSSTNAQDIGLLYHKILDNYHKENFEKIKFLLDSEASKKTREVVEMLFAKYKGNPVLGNVLETEYEFNLEIKGVGIPLYGFIDRIDEDKGVEYKTSSKKWKEEDVDNIQTDIYMYVLLKKFGRPIPMVYSINNKKTKLPPQIIRVEKSEKEILLLESKIKEYLKNVKKSLFEPTPGGHCYYCPWGNNGDGLCEYSK